jgi:hypothetical protein
VQKTAPHEPEGVRKTAYLGAQDSAHEDAQETAHLETGMVKPVMETRGRLPLPPVTPACQPSANRNSLGVEKLACQKTGSRRSTLARLQSNAV